MQDLEFLLREMASLEVAQVKKFFMPHLVGISVVPKALVTKTGSDFDIDKLTFYIPHYKVQGASEPQIINEVFRDFKIDKDMALSILKNENVKPITKDYIKRGKSSIRIR